MMRYEVHKNFETLFIGNRQEVADFMGFKLTGSIDRLTSPARQHFLFEKDNPENYVQITRIPPKYAVFKGDEFITDGTAVECAEFMGVKLESFRFYMTPTYKRRIAKRKNARNYITVIKLEEEEE